MPMQLKQYSNCNNHMYKLFKLRPFQALQYIWNVHSVVNVCKSQIKAMIDCDYSIRKYTSTCI